MPVTAIKLVTMEMVTTLITARRGLNLLVTNNNAIIPANKTTICAVKRKPVNSNPSNTIILQLILPLLKK
jgi:hypothetical protein